MLERSQSAATLFSAGALLWDLVSVGLRHPRPVPDSTTVHPLDHLHWLCRNHLSGSREENHRSKTNRAQQKANGRAPENLTGSNETNTLNSRRRSRSVLVLSHSHDDDEGSDTKVHFNNLHLLPVKSTS